MNVNTLRAISYITSVAAEELPILQWVAMLNSIYKDGIPEEATMGMAINYYIEKFPDFEKQAESTEQADYDKLYDDFIAFVMEQINKD